MLSRTTQSKHRAQLLQEYQDPLAYMNERTVRRLRIRYVIIALSCFLLGCVIWAMFIFGNHAPNNSEARWIGGGFGLVALAIFLPPYGIFRLLTIKRSIIAYRRRQLARDDTPGTKAKN